MVEPTVVVAPAESVETISEVVTAEDVSVVEAPLPAGDEVSVTVAVEVGEVMRVVMVVAEVAALAALQ